MSPMAEALKRQREIIGAKVPALPDPPAEKPCAVCGGTLRVLADPPEPWRSPFWTDCWECM